jgi:hypothetical protein
MVHGSSAFAGCYGGQSFASAEFKISDARVLGGQEAGKP